MGSVASTSCMLSFHKNLVFEEPCSRRFLFLGFGGPADIRFIWEKNRHALETCVPVQTHMLPDGRAHALSWLRDAVRETTEYSCSVLSSAGNQTSKVQITVMRHEAYQQEKWSQELAAWRAVAGEHDRLMQGWRKAWFLEKFCFSITLGKLWAVIEANRSKMVEETKIGFVGMGEDRVPRPADMDTKLITVTTRDQTDHKLQTAGGACRTSSSGHTASPALSVPSLTLHFSETMSSTTQFS
ncbi:hypothetical protein ACRRTK_018454 [Alexandromys fortis]